jgi:hypothetical protein
MWLCSTSRLKATKSPSAIYTDRVLARWLKNGNVQEPFIAMNTLGSNQEVLDKALKDWQFRATNFINSPLWLAFYG